MRETLGFFQPKQRMREAYLSESHIISKSKINDILSMIVGFRFGSDIIHPARKCSSSTESWI